MSAYFCRKCRVSFFLWGGCTIVPNHFDFENCLPVPAFLSAPSSWVTCATHVTVSLPHVTLAESCRPAYFVCARRRADSVVPIQQTKPHVPCRGGNADAPNRKCEKRGGAVAETRPLLLLPHLFFSLSISLLPQTFPSLSLLLRPGLARVAALVSAMTDDRPLKSTSNEIFAGNAVDATSGRFRTNRFFSFFYRFIGVLWNVSLLGVPLNETIPAASAI